MKVSFLSPVFKNKTATHSKPIKNNSSKTINLKNFKTYVVIWRTIVVLMVPCDTPFFISLFLVYLCYYKTFNNQRKIKQEADAIGSEEVPIQKKQAKEEKSLNENEIDILLTIILEEYSLTFTHNQYKKLERYKFDLKIDQGIISLINSVLSKGIANKAKIIII